MFSRQKGLERENQYETAGRLCIHKRLSKVSYWILFTTNECLLNISIADYVTRSTDNDNVEEWCTEVDIIQDAFASVYRLFSFKSCLAKFLRWKKDAAYSPSPRPPDPGATVQSNRIQNIKLSLYSNKGKKDTNLDNISTSKNARTALGKNTSCSPIDMGSMLSSQWLFGVSNTHRCLYNRLFWPFGAWLYSLTSCIGGWKELTVCVSSSLFSLQ